MYSSEKKYKEMISKNTMHKNTELELNRANMYLQEPATIYRQMLFFRQSHQIAYSASQ